MNMENYCETPKLYNLLMFQMELESQKNTLLWWSYAYFSAATRNCLGWLAEFKLIYSQLETRIRENFTQKL